MSVLDRCLAIVKALRQEYGEPGKRGPDTAGPEREGNAFEFDSKFTGKGINLKNISEGAMFGPSEKEQ